MLKVIGRYHVVIDRGDHGPVLIIDRGDHGPVPIDQ